jgi:hypothetical protein
MNPHHVVVGSKGRVLNISSHYLYFRKCQDMKTILKLDWERKTSFFKVCSDL